MIVPYAIAAVALGTWWGLRKATRLPTVRVICAVIAGTLIVTLAGNWVTTAFAWIQKQAASLLPGNWGLLVPALLVAAFAGIAVLVLAALPPKNRPHQSAEVLALFAAVLWLAVGGTFTSFLHSLGA